MATKKTLHCDRCTDFLDITGCDDSEGNWSRLTMDKRLAWHRRELRDPVPHSNVNPISEATEFDLCDTCAKRLLDWILKGYDRDR